MLNGAMGPKPEKRTIQVLSWLVVWRPVAIWKEVAAVAAAVVVAVMVVAAAVVVAAVVVFQARHPKVQMVSQYQGHLPKEKVVYQGAKVREEKVAAAEVTVAKEVAVKKREAKEEEEEDDPKVVPIHAQGLGFGRRI